MSTVIVYIASYPNQAGVKSIWGETIFVYYPVVSRRLGPCLLDMSFSEMQVVDPGVHIRSNRVQTIPGGTLIGWHI